MNVNDANGSLAQTVPEQPPRPRLIRDPVLQPRASSRLTIDKFSLRAGEMYRIAYSVGGLQDKRVSRSIAVYSGESERRSWNGEPLPCLDFALPQGRIISLIAAQLVDARAATQNDHGQWVLLDEPATHRRRASRRGARHNP